MSADVVFDQWADWSPCTETCKGKTPPQYLYKANMFSFFLLLCYKNIKTLSVVLEKKVLTCYE